ASTTAAAAAAAGALRVSLLRLGGSINSRSLLQQFYNSLPIRRRFRKALKKGVLVWCKGQLKLPPVAAEGYPLSSNLLPPQHKQPHMQQQQLQRCSKPFKGRIQDLKAERIWFQD